MPLCCNFAVWPTSSEDYIYRKNRRSDTCYVNLLMGTLKPQSNGPLYSNTVTGIHWPLMGGLLHLVQR